MMAQSGSPMSLPPLRRNLLHVLCVWLASIAGCGLDLGHIGPTSAAAAEASDRPGTNALSQEELQHFRSFIEALFPQAAARGIDRASFVAVFRDLLPDLSVARAAGRQSEFERPFSAYFTEAVTQRRVVQGRAMAKQWQAELAAIADRSGVPAAMVLAAWGMESDFGRATGERDVIRSLATLAFHQPDRALFRNELLDALVMLTKRAVPRNKMTGSWAGAMGGPQFLPSTYLAHAVSYAGSGPSDIWTNVPDILASIATFLKTSGWQPGAAWGMEVRLPQTFAYATLHGDFRQWAALGLKRADGAALPSEGTATLFFPAGAKGPAFLLGDNYWVIKTYNNSDAYALSFTCLADQIAGGQGLHGAWPTAMALWSRSEKAEMQRLLQRLGYYKGVIDGRFGPSSRDAIHAFQISVHDQPADGVGGANLLDLLRKKAGE